MRAPLGESPLTSVENGSRPGWGRGLAESVLTAFALGAVTGLLALGLETLWAGRPFSLGGAIGYTLLGGTLSGPRGA